MPHLITVPRLGWSMEEGVFAEWLKAPEKSFARATCCFSWKARRPQPKLNRLTRVACVFPLMLRSGSDRQSWRGDRVSLLAEGEAAPSTVRVNPTTASIAALRHRYPTRREPNRSRQTLRRSRA